MSQDNTKNENNGNTIEQLRTIFTEEEIRSTVKAFVLSYLRGQITVDFPTAHEILMGEQKDGKKSDETKAAKKEGQNKIQFIEAIRVITGATKSTKQELETQIEFVFSVILACRSSGRINGTFMEFDIEKKIDDIETKLNATNKVVEELVNWLTDEAKNANKLS